MYFFFLLNSVDRDKLHLKIKGVLLEKWKLEILKISAQTTNWGCNLFISRLPGIISGPGIDTSLLTGSNESNVTVASEHCCPEETRLLYPHCFELGVIHRTGVFTLISAF